MNKNNNVLLNYYLQKRKYSQLFVNLSFNTNEETFLQDFLVILKRIPQNY